MADNTYTNISDLPTLASVGEKHVDTGRGHR